jgi:hypothetical protein
MPTNEDNYSAQDKEAKAPYIGGKYNEPSDPDSIQHAQQMAADQVAKLKQMENERKEQAEHLAYERRTKDYAISARDKEGKALYMGEAPPSPPAYNAAVQNAVETNRQFEERLARRINIIAVNPHLDADPRKIAVARTYIELGFMMLNAAVVKRAPVFLPEDGGAGLGMLPRAQPLDRDEPNT